MAGGSNSWHFGKTDCTGLPRDGAAHSIVFSLTLVPGESLSTASFTHAFDGYMNASFADGGHFEIDHDLDGSFTPIASWSEGSAPSTLTAAGPFDLTAFNSGRASEVHFRFRFQSAAAWVGPDNAAGWDIDDFRVDLEIFAGCDIPTVGPPPGNVGDGLNLATSGTDAILSWAPVADASSYQILRSVNPDFSSPEAFASPAAGYLDAGALSDPRSFFYDIRAVSGCGTLSAD